MSNEQETPESQDDAEVLNQDEAEQVVGEIAEDSVEELQEKLTEAEQKAQENWDKAVRVQAEMDNLRKRTQKDLENAHKFALEKFVKELVPVRDSLELGLKAAVGDSEEVVKFREGTELTIKQFESVFEKFNIEMIDPVGQPFNPAYHQAMSMVASDDVEPNTVINVFQKGYLLNGRLVHPAMVVVAKAEDKPATDTPKIDEQA